MCGFHKVIPVCVCVTFFFFLSFRFAVFKKRKKPDKGTKNDCLAKKETAGKCRVTELLAFSQLQNTA